MMGIEVSSNNGMQGKWNTADTSFNYSIIVVRCLCFFVVDVDEEGRGYGGGG